eukprot:TRINITY_DN32069_c0_g1_i1.p1 TRINITY_DN32069_c0_g1~~TRINITY_DN32069_c0_g1_i1.p1  ORF type:complete len:951 (-),score=173.80 TRINITY_DN32069_c0_g1_i1:89-2848(-)
MSPRVDTVISTILKAGDVIKGGNSDSNLGRVNRRHLVKVIRHLLPSITQRQIEEVLVESGNPRSQPVDVDLFVRWLFNEKPGFADGDALSTAKAPGSSEVTMRRPDLSVDSLAGHVFVHGSGDCDQLGLGDKFRERQKPALVRGLAGVRIASVACGGLHTLCLSAGGVVYSWGCGDDGALGRPTGELDCEPRPLERPIGVRFVACGDSHSCAIDAASKLWLWGSYKDSNGYIGIARPCQEQESAANVAQKCLEPAPFVVGELECGTRVSAVACGSNHTIVRAGGRVLAWGSNQCGQLGLPGAQGCEFVEDEFRRGVCLSARRGSGLLTALPLATQYVEKEEEEEEEQRPGHIVRLRLHDGSEIDAEGLTAEQVDDHLASGCVAIAVRHRDVAASEKEPLLWPQRVPVQVIATASTDSSVFAARASSREIACLADEDILGVYASAECSFVTTKSGTAYGCGLNGDGQVGVGFCSTAVIAMREVLGLRDAIWIGGGMCMSAALVGDRVVTWGRSDGCGHGTTKIKDGTAAASLYSTPLTRPRAIIGSLPPVRTVRCGGNHTLACTDEGDVYVWGSGVSHQLGNRPRDVDDPHDVAEDPQDELVPYLISSKRLQGRFCLLADGGAQHSVVIAWDGGSEEAARSQLAVEGSCDEEAKWVTAVACLQSDTWATAAEAVDFEEGREVIHVETSAEFWRVQVEAVYRRRNPYKLDNVPDLLLKYEGQEALLYTKICRKYDLDPSKFYADPSAWEGENGDVKDDDNGGGGDGACTSANTATLQTGGISNGDMNSVGVAGGGGLFGPLFGGCDTADSAPLFTNVAAPVLWTVAAEAVPETSTAPALFPASGSLFGEVDDTPIKFNSDVSAAEEAEQRESDSDESGGEAGRYGPARGMGTTSSLLKPQKAATSRVKASTFKKSRRGQGR